MILIKWTNLAGGRLFVLYRHHAFLAAVRYNQCMFSLISIHFFFFYHGKFISCCSRWYLNMNAFYFFKKYFIRHAVCKLLHSIMMPIERFSILNNRLNCAYFVQQPTFLSLSITLIAKERIQTFECNRMQQLISHKINNINLADWKWKWNCMFWIQ